MVKVQKLIFFLGGGGWRGVFNCKIWKSFCGMHDIP